MQLLLQDRCCLAPFLGIIEYLLFELFYIFKYMLYDLFRPPAMRYTSSSLFYTTWQLLVVLVGVVVRVVVVVGRNMNS